MAATGHCCGRRLAGSGWPVPAVVRSRRTCGCLLAVGATAEPETRCRACVHRRVVEVSGSGRHGPAGPHCTGAKPGLGRRLRRVCFHPWAPSSCFRSTKPEPTQKEPFPRLPTTRRTANDQRPTGPSEALHPGDIAGAAWILGPDGAAHPGLGVRMTNTRTAVMGVCCGRVRAIRPSHEL